MPALVPITSAIARTVQFVHRHARYVARKQIVQFAMVRAQKMPLLDFSVATTPVHLDLKRLLRRQLYEHPRVLEMAERSQAIVRDLFDVYMNDPAELTSRETFSSVDAQARMVSDYIAGMTDRFAIAEHARLVHAGRPTDVLGEIS